jgi:hydrogenase-4 component F
MELTGNAHFARILMLAMGFLSIFVCAVYISRTNNYKRMLAYSSIENMGIVMIGAALGGIGLFAALLHILAHAFIKASFFLTSGNVLTLYGSRLIGDVHGLYRRDKKTAWLWLLSFTGITGMPPFPLFISEFLIVKAFFDKGLIFPMAVFALLICIILYGISSKVLGMCFGQEAPAAAPASEVKLGFMRYLPQAVFLSAMLIIGLVFPESLVKIIREAASLL